MVLLSYIYIWDINSACVFFLLASGFFFVGDKVSANYFRHYILPLLKEKYWIKLALRLALNSV